MKRSICTFDESGAIKVSTISRYGFQFGIPFISALATQETSMVPTADKFILPDLIYPCNYPLRVSMHCEEVALASEEWLLEGANHSEKRRRAILGLKSGHLSAQCYPDVDAFHLRVCADFLNYLFNMDDWLDEFDVGGTQEIRMCCMNAIRDPVGFETDKSAGKMTKSFVSRMAKDAGPGCMKRFIHTMNLFFLAVGQQADDRAKGVIPDLESYIAMRRDTSGCKPSFALTEYGCQIDLPDEVAYHHVITALENAANDHITWSNDIFSYSVEQSRHDTHNMICVVMTERKLDLQQAVDFVSGMVQGCLDRFETNRVHLPSWGPENDRLVAVYVDGLQNWMVGAVHWSFFTGRYFGNDGPEIKKHRIVHLLPKNRL